MKLVNDKMYKKWIQYVWIQETGWIELLFFAPIYLHPAFCMCIVHGPLRIQNNNLFDSNKFTLFVCPLQQALVHAICQVYL